MKKKNYGKRKSRYKFGSYSRYQELHHKANWKGLAQGTPEDVRERTEEGKTKRVVEWTPSGLVYKDTGKRVK